MQRAVSIILKQPFFWNELDKMMIVNFKINQTGVLKPGGSGGRLLLSFNTLLNKKHLMQIKIFNKIFAIVPAYWDFTVF